jgi:hypothetical protein
VRSFSTFPSAIAFASESPDTRSRAGKARRNARAAGLRTSLRMSNTAVNAMPIVIPSPVARALGEVTDQKS